MKIKSSLLAMPLLALVGCALEAPVDANTPQLAHARFDYGNGRKTYATYCSGCHDNGTNGALTPSATVVWGEPSALWRKILNKHVDLKYLENPKTIVGPGYSEKNVADAIFYMITQPGNRGGAW
jgi:cytochrome c5